MRRFTNLYAASLFAICVSASSIVFAEKDKTERKKIIGHWGFTTDLTCARSQGQAVGSVSIDPNTLQFNTEVDIVDMSGFGEMTFTKDGHFTLFNSDAGEFDKSQLHSGAIPITDGFIPICHGNYSYSSPSKFELEFDCIVDVKNTGVVMRAGPLLADGFVSLDGQSATINIRQNVQTIVAYMNDTPIEQRQRICLHRFSLVKLGRR